MQNFASFAWYKALSKMRNKALNEKLISLIAFRFLMHDSMRTLSQRKKRDNYVGLKRPSYSDLAQ